MKAKLLFVFLGCASLVIGGFFLYEASVSWMDQHPIRHIDVHGSFKQGQFKYIEAEQLAEIITFHTENQSYFGLPVKLLENQIQAMAWVEAVQVDRVWPDRVKIHIRELTPIAIWLDEYLISSKGDLVQPGNLEAHQALPKLYGEDNQLVSIMDNYVGMAGLLRKVGLSLEQLELSSFYHWRLQVLREGLPIEVWVDRENTSEKLLRFTQMLPSIIELGNDPERIDLRYPKGIAVQWVSNTHQTLMN